jgi:hypothetical protein
VGVAPSSPLRSTGADDPYLDLQWEAVASNIALKCRVNLAMKRYRVIIFEVAFLKIH